MTGIIIFKPALRSKWLLIDLNFLSSSSAGLCLICKHNDDDDEDDDDDDDGRHIKSDYSYLPFKLVLAVELSDYAQYIVAENLPQGKGPLQAEADCQPLGKAQGHQ